MARMQETTKQLEQQRKIKVSVIFIQFDQTWLVDNKMYAPILFWSHNNFLPQTTHAHEWQTTPLNGFGFQRTGLKTGVENDILWYEIGSEFREPGGAPRPPQEFRGVRWDFKAKSCVTISP